MTNKIQRNTLYLKSPTVDWVNLSRVAYQRYQWKPVLWTGMQKSERVLRENYPDDVDYYIQEEAMLAIAPTFPKCHNWISIDAEILANLSFHQPIVQHMLNRWFINADKASFKSRSQYYNRLVEIWLNIFDLYQTDLIICPTIPHRVFDYIAYMVAQYKKIPFLMVEATAGIKVEKGELLECYFVIDNLTNRTEELSRQFQAVKQTLRISNNTKEYIARVQSSYDLAKPKYLIDKERNSTHFASSQVLKSYIPMNVKVWIKFLIRLAVFKNKETATKCEFTDYFGKEQNLVNNPSILRTDLYNAKSQKNTKDALNWYVNNSEELKSDQPYILFAASKQPERSTCPDAGYFYSHLDIIKTLVQVLPSDYFIYYKEHPSNFRKPWAMDAQRTLSYYENLMKIAPERIKFLRFDTDPFLAIDSSTAVASATGSTCWEAIIRGKPSFIFGSNWFENCPGVFKFKSIDGLIDDIKAVESGFTPDIQEISLFIEFMYRIDENIQWRRDIKLGAEASNISDQVYMRRLSAFAKSYHNGLERYEQAQSRKKYE